MLQAYAEEWAEFETKGVEALLLLRPHFRFNAEKQRASAALRAEVEEFTTVEESDLVPPKQVEEWIGRKPRRRPDQGGSEAHLTVGDAGVQYRFRIRREGV